MVRLQAEDPRRRQSRRLAISASRAEVSLALGSNLFHRPVTGAGRDRDVRPGQAVEVQQHPSRILQLLETPPFRRRYPRSRRSSSPWRDRIRAACRRRALPVRNAILAVPPPMSGAGGFLLGSGASDESCSTVVRTIFWPAMACNRNRLGFRNCAGVKLATRFGLVRDALALVKSSSGKGVRPVLPSSGLPKAKGDARKVESGLLDRKGTPCSSMVCRVEWITSAPR